MRLSSTLIKRLFGIALLLGLAPAARPLMENPASLQQKQAIWDRPGVAAEGTPEDQILFAIDAIRQGRFNDAGATVDQLLTEQPNYRLAHLLRADLYAMRAMPLRAMGGGANAPSEQLEDLRQEALVRLRYRQKPPAADALPGNLLVFSPRQKHAILVDASTSRLFVFENRQGIPVRVADFYTTVGKLGVEKQREGDQRTPLGVYFITSFLSRAQLDRNYGNLADLYGVGAWPLSYPNEWDKREGKTGYGIWLHGSPAQTYARPPQASNGCVVLTNPEMLAVSQWLDVGQTPVVITPKIEWLHPTDWHARQENAMHLLDSWRNAWEVLDNQRYFSHYSAHFRSEDGLDFARWRSQKFAVASSKKWVRVALNDISIFATGGEKPQLVSTFVQEYKSNNLENRMKKRVYWNREGNAWKIAWEGAAAS